MSCCLLLMTALLRVLHRTNGEGKERGGEKEGAEDEISQSPYYVVQYYVALL